ncbi:MAG TPA: hypothetical protein VE307_00540 [Nitrososphaeraceae archaeon]|nr:hypothetical protein [Nitrososphaeraceae archaeon]
MNSTPASSRHSIKSSLSSTSARDGLNNVLSTITYLKYTIIFNW